MLDGGDRVAVAGNIGAWRSLRAAIWRRGRGA
jgi:hypothetical protein